MEWARILAYITGTVDQELLLRNEYLVAENRILKSQLKGRLKLSDVERTKLGEIGHRLGRKALGEVAATALPDTILAWYRRLIARKFDGSQARRAPGRPRIDGEVEQLIVRMASDDPAVLDHALHADNTRVDRGNPAIAVLSIGYQSRLLLPRSGLERSDFVPWHFSDVARCLT